jgi:zinc transport system substrate-binding protein
MKMILMRIAVGRVLVAACLLASAGCSGRGDEAAADPGRPTVLAAFYPYYFAAQRVGGPDVTVELITEPGVEPHDLELSPRQVAAIGRADLVIYQKAFQPAVDDAVRLDHPRAVLDVNEALDRAAAAEPLAHDTLSSGRAAVDEAAQAAAAAPTGDLAADPHVWLDPRAMERIAAGVAEALARTDPSHAEGYRARAADLTADLKGLDRDFAAGLASCPRHEIVTNHAAFGHLAARYGLTQIAVSGLTPELEPSPRRLAALVGVIRDRGVGTVFTETLASTRVADTLAREGGARMRTLDPLEGLQRDATGDYLSVMRDNLTALRDGLGCAPGAVTTG